MTSTDALAVQPRTQAGTPIRRAPLILQRLAYKYSGPAVVFPNMPDPPPGFVTRITPERIGGVGPWEPATLMHGLSAQAHAEQLRRGSVSAARSAGRGREGSASRRPTGSS